MFSPRLTAMALAVSAALPALATPPAKDTTLNPIIVTASGLPVNDSDATYASEVHDRAAIEASGAGSLHDFLAQNTSLNVMPNYGNRNAPNLDLRGYGTEAGYQNIVVVLDGQRLSSIDQTSAYLGGIPLSSVESIEISKGSGSVAFGDGAMAGVIQIRTRPLNGVSVSAMTGSRGAGEVSASAGLVRENFSLAFASSDSRQPSLSDKDVKGHLDGGSSKSNQMRLSLQPSSALKLNLAASTVDADTRYIGSLTEAEFSDNPTQNSGNTYNHQIYQTRQWRTGFDYRVSSDWSIRYQLNREDKTSDFLAPYAYRYDYDTTGHDLGIAYRSRQFDVIAGIQQSDSSRRKPGDNITSKDNVGIYLNGIYRLGALTLSGGARTEQVDYEYAPDSGTRLKDNHRRNAWDVGANFRFNEQWSAFGNLNQAFQMPDIDRFFHDPSFSGVQSFNGFIKPAQSRTLTIGANHDTAISRIRLAAFHSRLRDEIYYDPNLSSGENTNIDRSHKTGIEFNGRWQVSTSLSFSTLYTYTRAIIDREDSGSDSLDGNKLPGVPRHGVTIGLNYQPWANGNLNITHTWREKTYSMSNIQNDEQHKQPAFESTNVVLRHRWQNLEGFIGVDNLFDHKNGLGVYSSFSGNNSIYPVNFRRTGRIGIKISM